MNSEEPVLEYRERVPAHVGAWVVFCLALAAAVGFFLVVPAVVVFIAALLVRHVVPVRDTKGRSLATVATWVSFCSAAVGVLFLVFMPSIGRTRVGGHGMYCASNLRGITQSMNVYAADGDWYPIVGASYSSTLASALPGLPGPADTLLSNKPGGLYTGTPPGNVAQSMWLMVISGQVAPKQFLCKSDPAAGTAALSTMPGSANYYSNFTAGPGSSTSETDQTYSYSFAFITPVTNNFT